jgi:hypothetical protein
VALAVVPSGAKAPSLLDALLTARLKPRPFNAKRRMYGPVEPLPLKANAEILGARWCAVQNDEALVSC